MKILSLKSGHDGAVAFLDDGSLIYSIEAEKNNFPRYSALTASTVMSSLQLAPDLPDVFAVGGWWEKNRHSTNYKGVNEIIDVEQKYLGRKCRHFSSSHERSHIFGSFGMSDLPEKTPCYVLLWEGTLGSFYELDEQYNIHSMANSLLEMPGEKYVYPYFLAHPKCAEPYTGPNAGTVMALTAYRNKGLIPNAPERALLDKLLKINRGSSCKKDDFQSSHLFNQGVESEQHLRFGRLMSDKIFNIFFEFAEKNLLKKLPLIIGGGCGLNCEWNTRWKNSGLFPEVFVPPCANDSGSAIGTAIDAQRHYTGSAKISWSVYSGEEFVHDVSFSSNIFQEVEFNVEEVAKILYQGKVVAWVQGRCEIGPRALGNRSILASPFLSVTKNRLNKTKEREYFRPVAPVCLEEDVGLYFEWSGPSPHMLYFQNVKDTELKAVTHVDGSARVQTVNELQNVALRELLLAFRKISGKGVLCNTSLNFPGRGFINQMSDLISFCERRNLDGFIVGERMFIRAA